MKTILFDIETFPAVVETWGTRMYDEQVIRVLKPWELASFAYKELGKKDVFCHTREGQKSDKRLMQKLQGVLDKADLVIAHNGDKFDVKKSNTRMIKHNILPYAPTKTIDTLKEAKKHFAFTSNRLNDLAEFLGVGQKIGTSRKLWDECREDKPGAWRLMEKYNKQDVLLLERVYLKMRPWIKHPIGIGALNACPKCGSERLQRRGVLANRTTTFRSYQCQSCGGWSRSRLADKNVPKREVVGI